MNNLFESKNISRIGIGTWQMGLKGWGKDYNENAVLEAFIHALTNGINFIDTAEVYGGGHSEELIGRAIESLDRNKLLIATKLAGYNTSTRRIQKSIEGSLKRLNVEYIDLYQIHWEPSYYTNLGELFRILESNVNEGLIRHIGVSNFSLNMIKKSLELLKEATIESNQVKFNLIERPGNSFIEFMNSRKIKIIAWSPLGQGFLSGKYSLENKPVGGIRKVNRLFSDSNLNRFDPLLSTLRKISYERDIPVIEIVLSFEADMGILPIPGFKNIKQVNEIVSALNIRLTNSEKERIIKALNITGTIEVKETLFPRMMPNSLTRIASLFL